MSINSCNMCRYVLSPQPISRQKWSEQKGVLWGTISTEKEMRLFAKYAVQRSNIHAVPLAKQTSDGGGPSQQTLPSMMAGRRCDTRRSEEITQKICSMVEKDILPIGVASGDGFSELLGYVEPNYWFPSRPTITRRLEARFEERKKELKTQLASTKFVAITTDCWTALSATWQLHVTTWMRTGKLIPLSC